MGQGVEGEQHFFFFFSGGTDICLLQSKEDFI